MRVGITGASGLIGSQLCQALEERGDEVIRFVRPETKSSASKVVRWNPGSGDVDENDLRAAGGFDAVIHLAGAGIGDKRWSKSRKNEILNSRLDTTKLLVTALQSMNSGVPHLLSGSAIGFYGSRGDESLTEASSRGSGFLSLTTAVHFVLSISQSIFASAVPLRYPIPSAVLSRPQLSQIQ